MDLKVYKKMLRARPFIDEVKWQKTALFLEDIWNKTKVVLAAGTSSGKTFFTIMYLNMFYSVKGNRSKRSLIIPSSQTNLRTNFVDALEDFNPDFEYIVATSCEELRAAIKTDVPVIVCLPQTVSRCLDILPQLEKLILDEAHTWYFKKTIKSIIKKTKPVQQFLLTGTPAPFIMRGNFFIHFVPVMELFNEGRIANTEVHVISSNYEFKNEDYNHNQELKGSAKVKMSSSAEAAIKKVVLGMIRKLRNPIKGLKDVNRLTKEAGGLLFNHLEKTIIWASSIAEAEKFTSVLRSFKGLENAVLVSHSKNDDDSELMNKFKEDPSIKVLVSVNRGRMGWSYTELYNAVDFTMTRNLSTILQMLARLFRISKVNPSKMKYFYKVSNAKDSGYFTIIMKGVLLLLDKEWYSKFNGKNFNGMEIPVTVPRKPREEPSEPSGNKAPKKGYRYEMLDLPLDMNFFKTVYSKQDDPFTTVAWTTIGKVRSAIFGYRDPKTLEESYNAMYKCSTLKQFRKEYKVEYFTILRCGDRDRMYKAFNVNISLEDKIKNAKKYKSYSEWRSKEKSHWLTLNRENKLDEVKRLFEVPLEKKQSWDLESAWNVVRQYDTYTDLNKNMGKVACWFKRQGLAKEVREYYRSIGDKVWSRPLTIEERLEIAKKYNDYRVWKKENPTDANFLVYRGYNKKVLNELYFGKKETLTSL